MLWLVGFTIVGIVSFAFFMPVRMAFGGADGTVDH
jgi:hypothetical protein